jgi:hypothetical protein
MKFLLKFLCFLLESEYFEGGRLARDAVVDGIWLSDLHGGCDHCLSDAQIVNIVNDRCMQSMVEVTFPCDGLDGSNHLGHLPHHFAHGFRGWLPNNDVHGLCRHDEADCLMNGQASG